MTPTLLGRWQTRLLLYVCLGLPITCLYAIFLNEWRWPPLIGPFTFISAILVLGLFLDVAYAQLQRLRWDQDWPFAFQFVFSIVEFFVVYGLMNLGFLDEILPEGRIPLPVAATHFAFVFVPSFLALVGGLQIFLPRWRYNGGELGRP